jgi:predicted N-acetyltransferase YhbS
MRLGSILAHFHHLAEGRKAMTVQGPRALKRAELRSAVELADRVFRSGQGHSMEQEYGLLFAPGNRENLRVFADRGRVVSLVGMLESDVWLLGTRHVCCCIGSVCTDPDYRGRGLATELMEDARRKALSDGADLFLISGGRGLYRRLGYVDVGSYHVYRIERSRLPAGDGYSVRPWRPEDVPALTAIHSAEPVRFARAPEDFVALLSCGQVVNVTGGTAVVCRVGADEPAAYLSFQIGGAPWEKKAPSAVTVAEMGGPRWVIAQALGPLMRERGVDELEMHCLGADREMAELAHTFGWPSRPRGFHGTVGIIHAARFWKACAPLVAERLGPERAGGLRLRGQRRARLALGDEQVVLDGMSAFTNLVFLPPHRRGELALGLGRGSALQRTLDELFPLPLVDYGLNYV